MTIRKTSMCFTSQTEEAIKDIITEIHKEDISAFESLRIEEASENYGTRDLQ